MTLVVRIKPRAERQIEAAALWWSTHRTAAPGAIRLDLGAALAILKEHPGIGSKVENAQDVSTRRLYLSRTHYFVYYRVRAKYLDVVAFWHSSRDNPPAL